MKSGLHKIMKDLYLHCAWLAMPLALCILSACDTKHPQNLAKAASSSNSWVANGPTAWEENLAPEAIKEEDGFPKLVDLLAWLASNPGEQENAAEPSLDWAKTYFDMMSAVTERRRWSGRVLPDRDMRAAYGGAAILGISDGQSHVSNQELIEVAKAAESALKALRTYEHQDEAEQMALKLFALAERFGRNKAGRDKVVVSLQISIGATATEYLTKIAEDRGDQDAAQRYRDIYTAIEEYGNIVMQRMRDGP